LQHAEILNAVGRTLAETPGKRGLPLLGEGG
jgi:hypothetical protein